MTLLLTVFLTLYVSPPWLIYLVTGSLSLLISLTYFSPPLTPSPLTTTCLFSVSIALFLFCYICSFVLFFRFHIQLRSYSSSLSLSDLFYLAQYPLDPFMLSQMARFHSFLWPSNIPLYTCTTSSLSIHLSMDT